jgi:hypothetical protein
MSTGEGRMDVAVGGPGAAVLVADAKVWSVAVGTDWLLMFVAACVAK